ncbi:flagellar basal body rod protein FlgB [Desulfosoma caldarium]|uniref:Flagellar basal body rod protein FlgB n=1 Tax=Desulfosoma caldarium TaxID=610254 RepID=A0A3N1VPK4_9BACT|nr:flagellar basal body rod protein FlgB [Desulfosoma caldarium]ROR01867.1 flagellar basal-body rod protein FlgB [Desulfosoma caldarium]
MAQGHPIDRTVSLMQDRLNLNALTQKVVAANLANINTPRYVAKRLSFEDMLKESLEENALSLVKTSAGHRDPTSVEEIMREPEMVEVGPVDLDAEMVLLAHNSVEYQFILTMLNKKFSLLRTAIEGGR